MSKIENPAVARIFDNYPEPIRKKMMRLRQLVLDRASETEGVDMLEETLKWGEPSYLAEGGSTIRVDWKDREPDQHAMYFNCNTSLVDTFKALYGDVFTFEANRAIVFGGTDSQCGGKREDQEDHQQVRHLTRTLLPTAPPPTEKFAVELVSEVEAPHDNRSKRRLTGRIIVTERSVAK